MSEAADRGERVFQRREWLQYGSVTLASIAAFGWFAAGWVRSPDWMEQPVLMSLLSGMVLVTLADIVGQWCLLPFMRRPELHPPPAGLRVAVATTFVPDGEPLSMLEGSLAAMVAMDYPHDTWVLDEGDDDRVKQLCKRLGALHFSRKSMTDASSDAFDRASKSGNCNAFFKHVVFGRCDVVTTFDSDHVPSTDYLTLALGPFVDPKVAYVQLPQAYSNASASTLARGAAEETYGYHSAIQMANHGLGYPIIVGGHNTHRVIALQEIGGYGHHEADDLLTTARYQAAGWKGVYIPRIAARGLVPESWSGYLRQQRRWARSMLDVKVNHLPRLLSRMTPLSRLLSVAQGLNFVFKAAVLPVLIGVDAVILAGGSRFDVIESASLGAWVSVLACLMAGSFFWQRFYLDPKNERGVLWRAILLQFAKWPYMLLAITDVLSRYRPPTYQLTAKTVGRRRDSVMLVSQVGVVVLMAGAFLLGPAQGELPSLLVGMLSALVVGCAVVLAIGSYAR